MACVDMKERVTVRKEHRPTTRHEVIVKFNMMMLYYCSWQEWVTATAFDWKKKWKRERGREGKTSLGGRLNLFVSDMDRFTVERRERGREGK